MFADRIALGAATGNYVGQTLGLQAVIGKGFAALRGTLAGRAENLYAGDVDFDIRLKFDCYVFGRCHCFTDDAQEIRSGFNR
jgi:hypothetical protein